MEQENFVMTSAYTLPPVSTDSAALRRGGGGGACGRGDSLSGGIQFKTCRLPLSWDPK